jgi:putative toxin-antitoxin system antitoxin component (TIGR02293 family)
MPSKLKIPTFLRVYSKSREARLGPADTRAAGRTPCATMKPGQSKGQSMRANPTEIAKALGLANAESVTLLDLAHRCEEGLSKSCFLRLNEILAPEGRKFLNSLISPASLGRRKNRRLTPCESDCIVRLSDCWLMALETFQDESKAKRFLSGPHPLLGGRPPLELAAVSTCGVAAVHQLLGRLIYGSVA